MLKVYYNQIFQHLNILMMILFLSSICSCTYVKQKREPKVVEYIFNKETKSYFVAVDKTISYRPTGLTEIWRWGVNDYDWKLDIYLANKNTREIKKIISINDLPTSYIDLKKINNECSALELIESSSDKMELRSYQICIDGSKKEILNLRRTLSLNHYGRQVSKKRNLQYGYKKIFSITENGSLEWNKE